MISDQNNWSKGLMTLYTSRALHQAKEGQKRELRSFQVYFQGQLCWPLSG